MKASHLHSFGQNRFNEEWVLKIALKKKPITDVKGLSKHSFKMTSQKSFDFSLFLYISGKCWVAHCILSAGERRNLY
jgi:hypothetical protein